MNSKLKIAIIQSALFWEDIDANLSNFEEQIFNLEKNIDIIVLPETFNTGFSDKVGILAEPENYKTFKWLKQMAAHTRAAICGSYFVKAKGEVYNRFYFVKPNGEHISYDKIQLFSYSGEHIACKKGDTKITFEYKGWQIKPIVCYDLRFPEICRNHIKNGTYEYDLLICVANWPSSRIKAWNNLLFSRAIENSCFAIGANIVGKDGRGIQYNGHSKYCSPLDDNLAPISETETILTSELDLEWLKDYRKKFPFLEDA